jgi:coenzyme PQQ synthesis protein D (PqqD)
MLTISSTIRQTKTQDGAVLLDLERGQMLCLNPVGARVLELIAAGCEESDIADQLSAAYGREPDAVRADVREFLEALSQHQVLKPSERATGEKR